MKKDHGELTRARQFLFAPGVPILFFIFVFTPQRAVQFITLFFILVILGSKAYSEYLVNRVRLVRRDREIRIFRYEWTGVELWLENSGRLPAFLLIPEDFSGGAAVFRNIKALYTLGGKRRQLFRWEVYGSERGVFTLGPARLRGADPLGLFPFTLNFEETARLFVYPAPAFAALKSPGGIPLGNLLTSDPFNEDITRRRSLKEYTPGDDSRRINWKASAKNAAMSTSVSSGGKYGGPLLVNEYELSLSYPLVLFLNVDIEEYSIKRREPQLERVIEAAAALCLMAARERQSLGMIIHGASRAEEQDAALLNPAAFTLIPVLERLAALKPFERERLETENIDTGNTAENIRPGLRASTVHLLEKGKSLAFGTRLIYAGPVLGEEDYHALETLRRRRVSVEFLIIDEKALEGISRFPRRGIVPKYQIKDTGYEIL